MGGETPNLADLSVFGVLCAIEGCEAFNDLRANTDIGPWFDSMKEVAKNRQGQVLLSKWSFDVFFKLFQTDKITHIGCLIVIT